jgi:hypothetical protein
MRIEEERGRVWGVLGEFETPEELLRAARRAREAGYRRMDAYTPFPIHGLSDAMAFRPTKLPLVVLAGGLVGCATALLMMWFSATIHYPINVAGKPLGMLGMNGLPMPYHPIFNAPRFAFASRDRFFLCIESRDPKFDESALRKFFETLGAKEVTAVEE